MTRQEALAAITINPAKIVGLDGEIGSLEIGKRADLALFTGDPLEVDSRCARVFMQGKEYQ